MNRCPELPGLPKPAALGPLILAAFVLSVVGCGTTRNQEATEQLVLSSAVDNSIAAIDFRPLSGHKVYFDDTYIKGVKSANFVNAEYVISSLRQQIVAAGCRLQEKADEADIIIEGRVGTMGSDDHRVTYGIPENNFVGVAAGFFTPVGPRAPTMPEIAVARRDAREGAAKVAAFAYHRESREPLWQSGISKSIATSRNTWIMGVGPFQGGSIRDSSAVARQEAKGGAKYARNSGKNNQRPPVNYSAAMEFDNGWPLDGRPRPLPKPSNIASKPEEAGTAGESGGPSSVYQVPPADAGDTAPPTTGPAADPLSPTYRR